MSRYDYEVSRLIVGAEPTFTAVIMAAMRKADTYNLQKLAKAWPDVWAELQERYNTPGGFIASELPAAPPTHLIHDEWAEENL